MESRSKFSDMLLSLRSLLLHPFDALLGRLSSTLSSRLGQGGTVSSMVPNRIQSYRYDVFISFRGAIAVQKQILRQTVDEINLDTYSPSEISGIVRSRLCNRKVLLVLDNVDVLEQVQELAINPGLLGTGSRVIITTRDVRIVEVYGVHAVYEVPLLNHNDACELLHRKAFKSADPTSECVELTLEVLKFAQGLPLAVRVLGSHLYARNATQWQHAFSRLRNKPDNKIVDVLQVSFEGLHSEDKEIFLHIACFFKGEKEDYVKRILDACELHPHIGVQNLIDRSLITIRNQEIHMHEMLQELGKNIVRQQFPKEPGLWSRLWLYEDFHLVMTTESGTNKVKAIILDQKEDISEYPQLRAEGLAEGLSRMRGLTILILHHHKNILGRGALKFLPNSLQYLRWNGYPFAFLPSDFEPFRLVELNMPCSDLYRLWDDDKSFPCLKRVDLSNSKNLQETPNFAGSRKLEWLDLTGCIELSYVHPSIGLLEKLAFLSLEGCSRLRFLDIDKDNASNLCSLKVLHLSGCSKLEDLPDFRRASNLEYLDIDHCTSLSTVDQSIGHLAQLKFLSLINCTDLVSMPKSMNSMTSLVALDLCGCGKLEKLPLLRNTFAELVSSHYLKSLIFLDLGFCNLTTVPDSIGELRHLERLNLERNNFSSLPSSMGRLSRLAHLNLAHCRMLTSLPKLQLCGTSSSGGRYFKVVSGSHNHRSGLYIFNCPMLGIQNYELALSWLKRLVQNPCHFRCGFDIVFPGYRIPQWFDNQFSGNSRARIADRIKENNDWLGFAFCVAFEPDLMTSPSHYSRQQPYPLYLSFESEQTEETFDLPVRFDRNMKDDSNPYNVWLIYISRLHCHFVATGADITFKAHPGIMIKKWGLRMVFEYEVFSPLELWTNKVSQNQPGYLDMGYERASSSNNSSVIQRAYNWHVAEEEVEKHKIQLRYNWHVTEEEENENRELTRKRNTLSNTGLSI